MNCKYCKSSKTVKYGTKNGVQYYKCKECKRKFAETLAPEGMRHATTAIGESLGLFYDGLSLSDISRHLQTTDGIAVNPATIWRWVVQYSTKAIKFLDQEKVDSCRVWVIDETMLKINGNNMWLWDVIDEQSRFLLDTHISKSRTMKDAITTLEAAKKRALNTPRFILSDGLPAYPDAIEQVFGADSKHIKSKGFTSEINTNLIERFHGTLKERTKVMRGLKSIATAEIISEGFVLHYNFLRPHMTLKGTTPAIKAGIEVPFKTWIELVDYLGRNRTSP